MKSLWFIPLQRWKTDIWCFFIRKTDFFLTTILWLLQHKILVQTRQLIVFTHFGRLYRAACDDYPGSCSSGNSLLNRSRSKLVCPYQRVRCARNKYGANTWLCGDKFMWQSPGVGELRELTSFLMMPKQLHKCATGASILQGDLPVYTTKHPFNWRSCLLRKHTPSITNSSLDQCLLYCLSSF